MFSEVRFAGLFFWVAVFSGCYSCSDRTSGTHVIKINRVYVLTDEEPVTVAPTKVSADTSYLEFLFSGYGLTDIRELDSSIHVDLRYAGNNNFTGINMYDGLRRGYLTCEMAIKLCNAQHHLKKHHPDLSLMVLDAARPLHIQQMMWDSLDMPDQQKKRYLTPPEATSLHNYGCAVDVTLVTDSTGAELDMGTGFDEFVLLSQPRHEEWFVDRGDLSEQVLYNRQLLRHVMNVSGLRGISTEWWHYSFCSRRQAAALYPLIQ